MFKLNIYFTALLTITVATVFSVQAQQTGVKGQVLDIESHQPIAGASIQVPHTPYGTLTDSNGDFSLNLPINPNKYHLRISNIGYVADTVYFHYDGNSWNVLPIFLANEHSVLDEVVIVRRRERATELALLEDRRKSNIMLESIGAQELARKGLSDAKSALTKITGVTNAQSESSLFIRGLGDRYNATMLNGLPLPSENPLNKNISLDFFHSNIIQYLRVNKTFNAFSYGDVAGASIDIMSKEAGNGESLEFGAGSGINTQGIGVSDFRRIDGTSWFGSLKEKTYGIENLSTYSFQNKWGAATFSNPVNSSFNISGSKRFNMKGNNLSVFVTANMTSDYRYTNGFVRQTNSAGDIYQDQASKRYEYMIAQTAMGNAKYSFGSNHSISFNSLYIHDQNQNYGEYFGKNDPQEEADLSLFRRQSVIDNHLFVNQLLTQMKLSSNWKMDLSIGYNYVKGNEPDRRTNNLLERDGNMMFLTNTGGDNERYYSDITEKGLVGKAVATYTFDQEKGLERKIDFGYNNNLVTREFNATIFNHTLVPPYETDIDRHALDSYLNQEGLDKSLYRLTTGRGSNSEAFLPFWYTGKKSIHSGLASGTYQLSDRFTAVLGMRFDKIIQTVEYNTNLSNSIIDDATAIDKNYFLPNINLKYNLTGSSILRASASKSYTLPQFIEIAPFRNTFVNFKSQGNPNLVPVENINFDVKWDFYPSDGELLGIGTFYKQLTNPIARTEVASGGSTVTYFNVGGKATVFGVEAELKKNLITNHTSQGENILSMGVNLSYLYSKQLLEEKLPQFTYDESALQGASPFLMNMDLNYLLNGNNWNLLSTVVLNYSSDRIYTIGTRGFENIMEKGLPTLDFISTATIFKKWNINLKVKNITNPDMQLIREFIDSKDIVLESYRRGIDVSLGLSFKF